MALAQHLREMRSQERKKTLRNNLVRNLLQKNSRLDNVLEFAKKKASDEPILQEIVSFANTHQDTHQQQVHAAECLEEYVEQKEELINAHIAQKKYVKARKELHDLQQVASLTQAPELLSLAHTIDQEVLDLLVHNDKKSREEILDKYDAMSSSEIASLPHNGLYELSEIDKAYVHAGSNREQKRAARIFARITALTHPAPSKGAVRNTNIGDWQVRYNQRRGVIRGIVQKHASTYTFIIKA